MKLNFLQQDRVQCSLDVILRNYCIGVGGKIVKIQFENKDPVKLKLLAQTWGRTPSI